MSTRAWLANRDDLAPFDAELRAGFVGQELQAVRYVGLDHSPPTADGRQFHSIDFGVEFDLAGGATWSITWDQGGRNEGLLVAPGPMPVTPSGDLASWDYTQVWRERFPEGVQVIEAVWTRHAWTLVSSSPGSVARVGETETSAYCLTTLVLGVDRDAVAVTLGGGYGTEFSRAQFDLVSVFLSVQDARAAGALLPGDAEAITTR